jgi:protein gp37
MGAKTKIPWADATWNPVTGCSRVSAGCEHCYAERMCKRFRKLHLPSCCTGAPVTEVINPILFKDIICHYDRLGIPLRWRKPKRIFTCSLGDLFHPDVPVDAVDRVLEVMGAAKRHTFMLLTKRPERIAETLYRVTAQNPCRELGGGDYLPNLWIGVSVESPSWQGRVEQLASSWLGHKFVSFEPLLAPMTLPLYGLTSMDWVIVGGETGPGARPFNTDWAWPLYRKCWDRGIPFFFKSRGTGCGGEFRVGHLEMEACKEFPKEMQP